MKNLAFIGLGNMGKAIASGLVKSGAIDPANAWGYDPYREGLNAFCGETGIHACESAQEAISHADTVLIAVKPYVIESVLAGIREDLKGKALISVALGYDFKRLSALLDAAGVKVGLLTASLTASEKKKVRYALESGEIDLVIGTHALISEGVKFKRLALIIADEQHRFGVAQRSALAGKSGGDVAAPHVLVMSATPIPRTLALIVYGDLDISVIDQLPPGRTPVETYVIREDKRTRMYGFVRRQVEQGRQVYIICPAVEDDPDAPPGAAELKAVKTYGEKIKKEVFPDLNINILHGKMKPKEKEGVMRSFAEGEIQILVATTVVEVGVDVPNASLVVIEGAERFGLSQLHQLRGRVGRGRHKSYCVLVTDTRNPDSMHRLKTLASTTDGFLIAEEDLKLRGPGDFFGSRQHGMPEMRLADLTGDMRLLQQAQRSAGKLLSADPGLDRPENRPVFEKVRHMFADTPDIFN